MEVGFRVYGLSADFHGTIGKSEAIRRVTQTVESVAGYDVSVLVLGDSGTGKELIAKTIHALSPRRAHPFIAINCAAITETLLESELFGHVRGSFSGAHVDHAGVFESAHQGTLFLDEVGEISPALQVKLLRVLQEKEVRPVGGSEHKKIDVRIIAATHRDLEEAIGTGEFREDLYYRINVVAIRLPPLRERRDDIPMLVRHFLEKYQKKHARSELSILDEALDALVAHDWPGNIRQLEHVVERAVVLSQSSVLGFEDFPVAKPARRTPSAVYREAREATLRQFEREFIGEAMREAGGNVSAAARAIQLDKSNLRRLLRRHGLQRRAR